MATKHSPTTLVTLLLCYFLHWAMLVEAQTDPQLEQCIQKCSQPIHGGQYQYMDCERWCEVQYGHGGEPELAHTDLELEQCMRKCGRPSHDPRQGMECERWCVEKYEHEEEPEEAHTEPEIKHCMRKCGRATHDPRQRMECQWRCIEQHGRDEELEGDRQHKHCKELCWHEHPHERIERMECRRRCEEREQRGEQEREGGHEHHQQCKELCWHEYPHDRSQRRECKRRCEERELWGGHEHHRHCKELCWDEHPHDRSERRECKRRCEDREEESGHKPELRRCEEQCKLKHRQDEPEQRKCDLRCYEQYGEEIDGRGSGEEEYYGHEWGGNPYYWRRESFKARISTEEGNVRVLERFPSRSELLMGLENYRLSLVETNPNTFMIPSHKDAEAICFVIRGRGTITFVGEESKESHDLEQGDIIRVPAGTTTYLINGDKTQKLQIAELLQPVSTPGRFKEYYAAGGENPESIYRSFSDEILEAAFNAPMERIERVFGRQNRGAIIRATPQQIKALIEGSTAAHWPFAGESTKMKPYNMYRDKHPSYSNNFGQLYEADTNDYPQLRDLDVAVTVANITMGSMMAPLYNSRATKIAVVVDGKGYFEMACPHISGQQQEDLQEQEDKEPRYQKIRARLSPGDVFIAPAGHPIVMVASRDENLKVVCFEINAGGNKKYFLAGQNNMLKQIEREAKELSFGVPRREVEQFLGAQREAVFLPGPEQKLERKERDGRHGGLESIMSFVAF